MNQTGKKQEPISSLYVLKALCAFFVVITHSSMLYRDELLFLYRIAVPCFFAISGYFLYRNNAEAEISKAWNWTRKIFTFLIALSLLHAAFFAFWYGRTYSLHSLVYCLAVGSVPAVPLWYLAAFYQAMILFIVLRRMRLWGVWIIPIAILLDYLYRWLLFPNLFSAVEVWRYFQPLIALMFVGVGYFSAKYKSETLSPVIGFAVIVISLFILALLANYIQPDDRAPLCMEMKRILYATFVFGIMSLSSRYKSFGHPLLVYIGKCHSANIYYYHIIIKTLIVAACASVFSLHVESFSPLITFPCALAFSILICYVQSLWKRRNSVNG